MASKLIKYYLLLLTLHAAHIIEEVLVSAYFITDFYNGLGNFLLIQVVLLLIPVALLYFVTKQSKTSVYLSLI